MSSHNIHRIVKWMVMMMVMIKSMNFTICVCTWQFNEIYCAHNGHHFDANFLMLVVVCEPIKIARNGQFAQFVMIGGILSLFITFRIVDNALRRCNIRDGGWPRGSVSVVLKQVQVHSERPYVQPKPKKITKSSKKIY